MSDFVLCIDNRSNPASLIVGKVYRRLPDAEAEAHGMVRIRDEDRAEAEGYLYPAAWFVSIELPEAARQALLAAETATLQGYDGEMAGKDRTPHRG